MRIHLKLFLLLAVCLGLSAALQAQPLTYGADQWEIPVTLDGVKQLVTIVRDAEQKNVWYYVPDKPRLCLNEEGEPIFTMARYHTDDTKDGTELKGAVLQFSVNMAFPAETIEALKAAILTFPEYTNANQKDKNIAVRALPFKDLNFTLMTPDGKFVASAEPSKTFTTSFSTSQIPFEINLTSLGADLYKELCESTTGVRVWCGYNYYAITPPASIKITANWHDLYKHVSSSASLKAELVQLGTGYGGTFDKQKVLDELQKTSALKIEAIGNQDAWASDKFDTTLETLCNKIYKELFDERSTVIKAVDAATADSQLPTLPPKPQKVDTGSSAPKETKPATTESKDKEAQMLDSLTKLGKDAAVAVISGGASLLKPDVRIGFSYAMKDVQNIKKGSVTIDFNRRNVITRAGGGGGFIGVGSFLKKKPALKDKFFTIIRPGDWSALKFNLPIGIDAKSIGLTSLRMTVSVVNASGTPVMIDGKIAPECKSKVVTYDIGRQIWKRDSQTVNSLDFILSSLNHHLKEEAAKLQYKVLSEIGVKNQGRSETIKIEALQPIFGSGDLPLTSPLNQVETVTFDCNMLPWDEELKGVEISLMVPGDKTKTRKAMITAAKPPDKTATFTFKKRQNIDKPISAKIVYHFNKKINGKNSMESALNKVADILEQEGSDIYLLQEWEEEEAPEESTDSETSSESGEESDNTEENE